MPSIEGLDPTLQTIGTLLFVAIVAIFSGWSLVFGKKPAKSETKEFSMAGQLADMGPVKELVEDVGLLIQQMVRTNVVLERLATAFEERIEAEETQEKIEEKAQALFERRLAQERDAAEPPRRPPRKTE